MNDCKHDRVRRGPGSAYHEIECLDCRTRVGISVSVAAQQSKIDGLILMLKIARQDLIESERWEAWQAAHPGVEPLPSWTPR